MKKNPEEKLIEYCSSDRRICPVPHKWNEFFNLLTEENVTTVNDNDWPPPPLILAGWNYSSDFEKTLRWKQQIKWANKHDLLEGCAEFLYSLSDDDWYYDT